MPTPDFSKVWASNSPLPAYTFSDADYLTGWDFVGSAPPTKNEFDAWFRATDEKLNYLYSQLQDTASKLYPVGSVYLSFNATDPSTLFGGTWTRLKDRMLMASGDTYAPNTTGGSATVTLTTSNLPSHNHTLTTNGSHTHTASANTTGNHNHTVSGTIANAGDHTHTWSGSSASAGGHTHTWSGTSANAGKHTHTITASASSVADHKHTRGTMNIQGKFSGVGNVGTSDVATLTGAFYRVNTTANPSQGVPVRNEGAEKDDYFGFDASREGAWTGSTSANGGHTHTITASASSEGQHTHTLSGSNATNGNHTHTLSGSNTNAGTHTHTWSGSIGNNGNHTHTITVVANGNHTHTVGNTGGGLPVNTLSPYMTVYMWRRTA